MSIPRCKTLVYLLVGCLFLALALPVAAQETTAGMQGVVKDPTGAVIAKAKVEVLSPVMVGTKSLETDASGAYRFANLPVGDYTLTVNAAGFRPFRQTGIALSAGSLPSIDVTLVVGAAQEVVEVTGEGAIVDVTQSKVQTNITQDVLANVPKGRYFTSVIQFAPGARTEPTQSSTTNRDNGYQINGASNSENAYMLEGQETASPYDGRSAVNVPMEFVEEVQVKTNGFEAEFGGALGGVVNVIPKRGTNAWHGSAFTSYIGDAFNAAPNRTLRKNPLTSANSTARLDQAAEYYQAKKDPMRELIPGFELGGPIFTNRLYMYGSFAPDLISRSRTVNFLSTSPVPGARTFKQADNTYFTNARLDYRLTDKIRVFGSWTYSYERLQGSTLPQADSAYGQYNQNAGNNPDIYNYGLAYRYPNAVYNFGGDVTLTPNLVATTRYGLFRYDNTGMSTGTPVGIRYLYADTNYPYSATNAPAPATLKALNGTSLPSQFVNATGWSNIGANTASIRDLWSNYNFNQDLSWFKKGWGTHTFKVGYGFRHGLNNNLSGYNTALMYVAYNDQYYPQSNSGINNCNTIISQNLASYKVAGGTAGSSCQGLWGTVNMREYGTAGIVGGWNHSIYVQDAWTVGKGVTLNLGVRMDKESLPSYNTLPGFQGVSFGWGQKVAPRLGAAWDVFGNGKLKAYGSFGYFYDIMKYQLPFGSFGGAYWHDCVYALDNPDFTQLQPQRGSDGHYCPLGGTSLATGSFPSGALRFIENYDYREPANDPNQPGSLGATGLVDPNLKPMRQHQFVAGAEWALNPKMSFTFNYTRARLDRTIEDAGIITDAGEIYYITNPGESINKTLPASECSANCPINPKPSRRYDALEVSFTRRASTGFIGKLVYTYSALRGNYAGLTSSDMSDSLGRNGANTDRAFDEPFMQFDAHGKPIDGPLDNDRPHTFKAFGYYPLKWKGMTTDFGMYQQVYEGSCRTSFLSVWGAPVMPEGRCKYIDMGSSNVVGGNITAGSVSSKRMPIYANTDFNLGHEFGVSKGHEQWKVRFDANVANIFNQHSPVVYGDISGRGGMIRTGKINPDPCSSTAGCPSTNISGINYAALEGQGYDYIALMNSGKLTANSLYNLPAQWQAPRNMRFRIKFTF